VNTGGGSSNTLSTIILNNAVTNTSFTDASPTDGSIYSYFITAASPGGTSGNSASIVAVPLPAPPASAPGSLTANFVQTTNITLNWNPVAGAVGYVISRATSSSGPYTFLQSITETTYTDYGLTPSTIYYYHVAAMNSAGVSASVTDSVNSQQAYPASLTATPTNAAIVLSWSAASGATSYTVKRGTSAGGETTTIATSYSGTTYTNTASLTNGTTYYYVVTATGATGASGNSPEARAYYYVNPPAITSVQSAAGNLTISGSGGINNLQYVLLGCTNLAAATWVPIATNQFDSSGNFTLTLTNVAAANLPQTFYELLLP